jgi:hypothetical protein
MFYDRNNSYILCTTAVRTVYYLHPASSRFLSYNLCIHFIHNLDLDTSLRQIRADIKRIQRLLQREGVRHQRLQVQESALEQRNARRPGVPVPVDESQVDLSLEKPLLVITEAK